MCEAPYLQFCDELFASWLTGELSDTHKLPDGFQYDHCPEPYLHFGDQTNPLVFLTKNPGAGESFQTKSAVSGSASPIDGGVAYSKNASLLGNYYAGGPKITGTAQKRVSAMCALAKRLGFSGVLQVELLPFHRAKWDVHPEVIQILRSESPWAGHYLDALSAYLSEKHLVIALSGSRPTLRSMTLRVFAGILGMNLDEARMHSLTPEKNPATVGLFVQRIGNSVRAISCVQGNNILPSEKRYGEIQVALEGI